MGRVEHAAGNLEKAVELLGASEALRREVGAVLDAASARVLQEISIDLRDQLGTEHFQQLWVKGEVQGWEQTI
jgi:hypothetical protein